MKYLVNDMREYLEEYWLHIVIGLILAAMAADYAYADRGYRAAGGEIFVLPAYLFTVREVKNLIQKWRR